MAETERNIRDEEEDQIQYEERKRILFLGLPWTFTKYTITPGLVTVDQGLFKTEEDDCYMYKVQDVKLTQTLLEKMFKLGTITCYTGDVTNPELQLLHIKHSKEIKSYLLKASEVARIKRRTINTQDISAESLEDMEL